MKMGPVTERNASLFVGAVANGKDRHARSLFDSLSDDDKYAVAVLGTVWNRMGPLPRMYSASGVEYRADGMISRIVEMSAEVFQIPVSEVYSNCRTAAASEARQCAAAASYWQGCTMSEIATILGRTASTVSYSLSRVLGNPTLADISYTISARAAQQREAKL